MARDGSTASVSATAHSNFRWSWDPKSAGAVYAPIVRTIRATCLPTEPSPLVQKPPAPAARQQSASGAQRHVTSGRLPLHVA
eukprot:1184379-Prorocentrum_minimum.AAC.2